MPKGVHAVALSSHKLPPIAVSQLTTLFQWRQQRHAGSVMHGMHTASDTLWCLKGVHAQSPPTGWGALTQAFPSANHLVSTIQSSVSILRPLAGPDAAQVLRRGFADLFQAYTNALSAGFQKHQQPDGSFPYNLGNDLCSQCTSNALAWN